VNIAKLSRMLKRAVHTRHIPGGTWVAYWFTSRILNRQGNHGIKINPTHRALSGVYNGMIAAARDYGMNFATLPNGDIRATIDSITVNVTECTDFWTLQEVFIQRIYGCVFAPDTIVVDIGMNVGVASLWFAAIPNVAKVYGFEPFGETFEKCKNNLRLNHQVAVKVEAANFGIDGTDRELELSYNSAFSTGLGIYVTAPPGLAKNNDIVSVHMKAAAPIIATIRANHPGQPLFLKIDCEGSEFDIIPNLDESGELQYISGIIMEAHRADIQPIIKLLSKHFSNIFYYYRFPNIAIVYAA
jgi:FkbM family methyltransferase